tara:strand:- start:1043 stop:1672 length:630 start_codon:yes stop_codon:yes gene_type:complete
MNKKNLILIGAGGHSAACIDVIEQQKKFKVAGLVGLDNELNNYQLNTKVIGTDGDLPKLAEQYEYAAITLGQISTPEHRIRLYHKILELGFKLPTIVAPSAYVSPHAKIGAGTIIMHGAIINAGVKIGVNCIINNRALIEHDVMLGDHCHVSTGAIVNGAVIIGDGCFIGSGSAIKEGISIGRNSLIGMGLTVRHDVKDLSHYTGLGSL